LLFNEGSEVGSESSEQLEDDIVGGTLDLESVGNETGQVFVLHSQGVT